MQGTSRSRVQEDGEKFEHFVTPLKLLIKDCGYDAAFHNEMIRDSIYLVVNPVIIDGYASLFNCTTAVRASDSMTVSS